MSHSLLCIGHRGASGYRPENTLAAFAHAAELGCPWIELDVYAVAGELIVIHDDDLARTTNGTGMVMDTPLATLRALDAGDGERLPTLREVADLLARRVSINVELKGPDTAAPVSDLLNQLCEEGWQPEQFLLSSFDHRELAKADPRFARGALFYKKTDYLSRAGELGAYSINLARKLVDQDTVKQLQAAGYRVFVYTVNKPADIDAMRAVGVDGVFCDYPDRVLAGNP